MGGNKNKSAAQQEKSQNKSKESGKKDKKKGHESKQEVMLVINEDEATKIIRNSKTPDHAKKSLLDVKWKNFNKKCMILYLKIQKIH